MSKYFGAATNNGAVSGVKATQAEVEKWAEDTLKNTKASCVFIFEAVAQLEVAPRTIVKTELRATEENTRPDPTQSSVLKSKGSDAICKTCDPTPLNKALTNGSLLLPSNGTAGQEFGQVNDPNQYDTY